LPIVEVLDSPVVPASAEDAAIPSLEGGSAATSPSAAPAKSPGGATIDSAVVADAVGGEDAGDGAEEGDGEGDEEGDEEDDEEADASAEAASAAPKRSKGFGLSVKSAARKGFRRSAQAAAKRESVQRTSTIMVEDVDEDDYDDGQEAGNGELAAWGTPSGADQVDSDDRIELFPSAASRGERGASGGGRGAYGGGRSSAAFASGLTEVPVEAAEDTSAYAAAAPARLAQLRARAAQPHVCALPENDLEGRKSGYAGAAASAAAAVLRVVGLGFIPSSLSRVSDSVSAALHAPLFPSAAAADAVANVIAAGAVCACAAVIVSAVKSGRI